MADSNLFKPRTSSSGIGKKAMDRGQFQNPPEYPDVAKMTASSLQDPDGKVPGVQKTPSAKSGRV